MSIHDGTCKERLLSRIPFIGRKTLTVWQKTYDDIRGYYGAWREHLFARLWYWRVVRDIWLGSHEDFCCFCHVHVYFPRGGWSLGETEVHGVCTQRRETQFKLARAIGGVSDAVRARCMRGAGTGVVP